MEAVQKHAFVVLENLFGAATVDKAHAACEAALNRKNRNSTALPYELLRRSPFKEIVLHPIVHQVTTTLLGGEGAPHGFRWIRRCPPGGSAIARVHRDTAHLSENADGFLPIQLAVDILLTEFTPDNGSFSRMIRLVNAA